MTRTLIWAAMGTLLLSGLANIAAAGTNPPPGSVSLFNGTDLSAWVIPKGDNGHWKVIDSVIDYDAQSEARKDKNLWTRKSYGDFVLHIDWRIKRTTGLYRAPVVLPSGDDKRDKNGKVVTTEFPNADSGIYLRGNSKSQVNIWCWPIGSGEVYGYRKRTKSAEIRRGVTPKVKADHPVGQWNTFVITMKGDRLSAHAFEMATTRNTGSYVVQITNQFEKTIAVFHGRSSNRGKPLITYADLDALGFELPARKPDPT